MVKISWVLAFNIKKASIIKYQVVKVIKSERMLYKNLAVPLWGPPAGTVLVRFRERYLRKKKKNVKL